MDLPTARLVTLPKSHVCVWLAALTLCPALAGAAGGHHDVDDAVVLDPEHCQGEAWVASGRHPTLRLLHLGPACRIGAIEWGLTADRLRLDGADHDNAGPQMKWVHEVWPQRLNIGFAAGFAAHLRGPRQTVITTFVPVTAWLGERRQLQLHFNIGQDRETGPRVVRRWGLAADWSPNDQWTITLERRSLLGDALTRGGLRYNVTPLSSIDLSYAEGRRQRVAVLGYTVEWVR